jgi:hypothetical protein
MNTWLKTVKLNLFCLNLNIPVKSSEVSPQILHTCTEVANWARRFRIHTLHLFCESRRSEDSKQTYHLQIIVIERKGEHFEVLKRPTAQKCFRQEGCVDLLVKHYICENCWSQSDGTVTSWSSFQAQTCDTIIFYRFDDNSSWLPVLIIKSCNHFDEVRLVLFPWFVICWDIFTTNELNVAEVPKNVFDLCWKVNRQTSIVLQAVIELWLV